MMFMSLMSALLGCILIMAFVLFLCYTLYIAYIHRKFDHLPGPEIDSFYMGHLATVRKMYAQGKYTHILFCEWAQTYGPLYKIFIFHKCLVITSGPGILKEILTKSKYQKAKETYTKIFNVCGTRFLGRGLVTNTDHENWHKRRSVINPAFHKKYLKNLMEQFNKAADDWINKLSTFADGKTVFSMWNMMSRVTLDVIGGVGFHMPIDAVEDDGNPFPAAITKVLEGLSAQMKDPFILYRWSRRMFVRKVKQSAQFLRDRSRVVIETRLDKLERGEPVPDDILTFIIHSLRALPDMTIEDMVDDFVTLFIAGQETTANALSFLLAEVGRRPEIHDKLVSEIDRVVEDRNQVTFDDLAKLGYCGQVFKEALRMYPPAPGTARNIPEDTVIEGFCLPKDSFIVISFYILHRLPQNYRDPEQFLPERWDPGQPKPAFTYMPFSHGHRLCAGRDFAKIEAKVLLCKFFQKFRFELDTNQSFDIQETTTLRPKGGCMMKIWPR